MVQQGRLLALAALVVSLATAHPGEHHDKLEVLREMQKRGLEAMEQAKSIEACSNSEDAQARRERAAERRAATVARLRKERGLENGQFGVLRGVIPC